MLLAAHNCCVYVRTYVCIFSKYMYEVLFLMDVTFSFKFVFRELPTYLRM